jgi:phage terminase small subunit
MKGLTPKHRLFIAEYLTDLNATRAYMATGYRSKSPAVEASKLLRIPKVAAEIAKRHGKRLGKLEITADRVLEELALLGFANMLDYVKFQKNGKSFDIDFSKLTRDQAAAIQEVTVDATGGSNDGERRLVLRNKFKLADKRGALELLGKHLKLFPTKIEVGGPEGGPIPVDQDITVTFVEPK